MEQNNHVLWFYQEKYFVMPGFRNFSIETHMYWTLFSDFSGDLYAYKHMFILPALFSSHIQQDERKKVIKSTYENWKGKHDTIMNITIDMYFYVDVPIFCFLYA